MDHRRDNSDAAETAFYSSEVSIVRTYDGTSINHLPCWDCVSSRQKEIIKGGRRQQTVKFWIEGNFEFARFIGDGR